MNKSYRGLLAVLQEAAQVLAVNTHILEEGPLNPAQMKTKLGIGKDKISDEDMQTLMDITQDKKQLVALVRFYLETKDLKKILPYAQKMVQVEPKLDPQRFKNFLAFTEHIDAKSTKPQNSGTRFDLDSQKPDWQSQDGRYRLYDAHDVPDCIKYGHGYTFCISRPAGGNYHNYYRHHQGSKFYFIFDTKLKPEDEKYISVVDIHPDGRCEVTHKSNRTDVSTQEYDASLDKFLASKPGLEAARSILKPKPLTDDERNWQANAQSVYENGTFLQLTPQEQLRFVQLGEFELDFHDLKGTTPEIRNEYINYGGKVDEQTYKQLLSPGQKARLGKIQVDNGIVEDMYVFRDLTPEQQLHVLRNQKLEDSSDIRISREEAANYSEEVQREFRSKQRIMVPIAEAIDRNNHEDVAYLIRSKMLDISQATMQQILTLPHRHLNTFLYKYGKELTHVPNVGVSEVLTAEDVYGDPGEQYVIPDSIIEALLTRYRKVNLFDGDKLDPGFYQLPLKIQDNLFDPIMGYNKLNGHLSVEQVYKLNGVERVNELLTSNPSLFPIADVKRLIPKLSPNVLKTVLSHLRGKVMFTRDEIHGISDFKAVELMRAGAINFPLTVSDVNLIDDVAMQHDNLSKQQGQDTRNIILNYIRNNKYDKADFERNNDRLPKWLQQWLFQNS